MLAAGLDQRLWRPGADIRLLTNLAGVRPDLAGSVVETRAGVLSKSGSGALQHLREMTLRSA